MSYSVDLRERVLAAVERGMPRAEVVTTFVISSGTLKRWIARQRAGLDIAPFSPPGPSPTIPSDFEPELHAQLAAHSDATLAQHADLWNATHGTTLSQWTIGRRARALGWTRKKSRWVPPSETPTRATSPESASTPATHAT